MPYKQRVTGSSPVVPTKDGPVVQLVRMPACHAGGQGFEPPPGRQCASVAQLVERHLAKVEVASPSLVYRSIFTANVKACAAIWCHSQVVRQRSAKPLCPSSNLGVASKKCSAYALHFFVYRLESIMIVCAAYNTTDRRL